MTHFELRAHFDVARTYFRSTFQDIKKKFPFNDQFICNSVWINFTKRSKASWKNVQYSHNK